MEYNRNKNVLDEISLKENRTPLYVSYTILYLLFCKIFAILLHLGSVNIPLREIPSTGVEAWYKLEARSQRSSVQGRIRLRLWLSAREAGRHDDDNYQQVRTKYL